MQLSRKPRPSAVGANQQSQRSRVHERFSEPVRIPKADMLAVNMQVNRTPMGALKYQYPIEKVYELFGRQDKVTLDVMNESTDHKVRYIPEDGIFIMNMSGRMDRRELARRAEEIKKCLKRNLKNNQAIKVLADYRNVQWDSEATHYKAREIISGRLAEFRDYKHFSAILNDRYDGKASEDEYFFTKEQNALDWLRSL